MKFLTQKPAIVSYKCIFQNAETSGANQGEYAELFDSGVLRVKAKGESVKQLQTALDSLGYDPNRIDGAFGRGTKNAVIRFQTTHELTVDGVVGPATKAKLREQLAAREQQTALAEVREEAVSDLTTLRETLDTRTARATRARVDVDGQISDVYTYSRDHVIVAEGTDAEELNYYDSADSNPEKPLAPTQNMNGFGEVRDIADTPLEMAGLLKSIDRASGKDRQNAISDAAAALGVDLKDIDKQWVNQNTGRLVADGSIGSTTREAERRVTEVLKARLAPSQQLDIDGLNILAPKNSMRLNAVRLEGSQRLKPENVLNIDGIENETGKSERVGALQGLLDAFGFLQGTGVDGFWGINTKASKAMALDYARPLAVSAENENPTDQEAINILSQARQDAEGVIEQLEQPGANPSLDVVMGASEYLGYGSNPVKAILKFHMEYRPLIRGSFSIESVPDMMVQLQTSYHQMAEEIAHQMSDMTFNEGKISTNYQFYGESSNNDGLQYLDDWKAGYEDYFGSNLGYPDLEMASLVGQTDEGNPVYMYGDISNGMQYQPRKHMVYTTTTNYEMNRVQEQNVHVHNGRPVSNEAGNVYYTVPVQVSQTTAANTSQWNELLSGGASRDQMSSVLSSGRGFLRPSKDMIDRIAGVDFSVANVPFLKFNELGSQLDQLAKWNETAREGYESKRWNVDWSRRRATGFVGTVDGVWNELSRDEPAVHNEIKTEAEKSIVDRQYFRMAFPVSEIKGQPDTVHYLEGFPNPDGVGFVLHKIDENGNREPIAQAETMQALLDNVDYYYTHTGKKGGERSRSIDKNMVVKHEMRRWLFVESNHYGTRRAVDGMGMIRCDHESIGLAQHPAPYIPEGYTAINTYLPCGVLGELCSVDHVNNKNVVINDVVKTNTTRTNTEREDYDEDDNDDGGTDDKTVKDPGEGDGDLPKEPAPQPEPVKSLDDHAPGTLPAEDPVKEPTLTTLPVQPVETETQTNGDGLVITGYANGD